MQAIWSGAISFGLVNIPIKLYSGAEEHSLDLTMLHKKDHSPIRYARICKVEDREVSYEDIIKGYEYEKGQYIVLTEQDFEKASSQSTHTINIHEFTQEQEIDIRLFEKPYYLEPDKGGDKAYALLREALKQSNKVAIASLVLRNRELLAVIKPIDKLLLLNRLRFSSEVRATEDLKLPQTTQLVTEQEINLALKLINQHSKHFKPDNYHDRYSEDLQKAILAKSKGKKISHKHNIPTKTAVPDLMSALKASLTEKTKKTITRKRAA